MHWRNKRCAARTKKAEPVYPNQYPQNQMPVPPTSALDDVLGGVDSGEKLGSSTRLPKIPAGSHVLQLDYYGGFDTRSDGTALECEFIVESSDTQAAGTRLCTAWFPKCSNVDRRKFENGRITEFCAVIDGGLGQAPRSNMLVGRDMVVGPNGEMPRVRGLKIRCSAWPKMDRKTGAPVIGKKGPVLEYAWQAIPGQSYESAAATAKTMPAQLPRKQQVPHAAMQPQYAPPQYQQAPQGYAPAPGYPAAPPQGYAPVPSPYPAPGMQPGYAPQAPAPGGLPPGYPQPPAAATVPPGYPNPYAAQPQGQPNIAAGLRGA